MEKIIRERNSGKTTELIFLANNTRQYIVCSNISEVARIAEKAVELGCNIPFPLTFDEFINRRYYGKNIEGFLIDNVDKLLTYMFHDVSINAITLTSPVESYAHG